MDLKMILLPALMSGDKDAITSLLPMLLSSITVEKITDESFSKIQQFAKCISNCDKLEFVSMIQELIKSAKEAK